MMKRNTCRGNSGIGVTNSALLIVGVTTIVEVTVPLVLFNPVKEAIFPVPLAANPIDVVLFAQLYTVPETLPEKLTAATVPLLQTC